MGSCLSKKSVCASSSPPVALPDPPEKPKSETQPEKKEESIVKKEIFVIRHRISHEAERQRSEEKAEISKVEDFVEKGKSVNDLDGGGVGGCGGGGALVRTSSCTKEEVDAILIQCGRLSRSSSTGKAALSSENGGRKYSGSKRSYDFDRENGKCDDNNADGDDEAVATERENRRRERHRHHSQGRRRTPSRERERDQASQQRSGSRERGSSGGGGRRVSRSPGRRSESPMPTNNGTNSNSAAANGSSRPGKMVSVPATVSGGGVEPNTAAGVKRIQVKRNVGGASPRARSPARFSETHTQNQLQPISLSRSNSRKAEHSPYRRNPLGEIDTNIITQKPRADNKMSSNGNCKNQDQVVGSNVILAGLENPKGMMSVTRSRSSHLSRDLDINPEALSNPNTSYTALLLEDIQNFHQKNAPAPPPAFSLPPCLSKACSILEAVADLNSTSEFQRKPNPINDALSAVRNGKQLRENSILESEIVATDDTMQPSFHKYVTVRRGGATGGEEDDLDQQESSGSNSIVGSQQQWTSSSCWEPNSAESTDRWTSSSRSMNEISPVGYQRQTPASDEGGKKLEKRDADQKLSGIGTGRIVNGVAAAAASR